MNVLSLFDGISGAMLALKAAGIHVDKYYASELDRHCISVSKKQFPNIIHLGDVKKIDHIMDKIKFNNVDTRVGQSA